MEIAYKFIMYVFVLILIALIWIPYDWVIIETHDALNAAISDVPTQQKNDLARMLFYYSYFFIVIAGGIYVIKPENPELPT